MNAYFQIETSVMNNTAISQKLHGQVSAGYRDAYNAPLIDIARKAIAEKNSPPEQQTQLLALVELAEKLPLPSESCFPGSSAKHL